MGVFPIDVVDDDTPAAALATAAQAIRAFNHRTTTRFDDQQDGWRYPSDAYTALGELTYLAGALPQAIQHIDQALHGRADQGHLGLDHDSPDADPAAAVDACSIALDRARVAVQMLYQAIGDAQNHAAQLTYTGPDLPS